MHGCARMLIVALFKIAQAWGKGEAPQTGKLYHIHPVKRAGIVRTEADHCALTKISKTH